MFQAVALDIASVTFACFNTQTKERGNFHAENKCFSTVDWTATWATSFLSFFTLIHLSPSVSSVILVNVARNGDTGIPTHIFEL